MKARFFRVVRWLLRPDSAWHLVVAMLCVLVGLFFWVFALFFLNLVVGYEANWVWWLILLRHVILVFQIVLGLYALWCGGCFLLGVWKREWRRYVPLFALWFVFAVSAFFVARHYGHMATRVADEVGLFLHIRNHIDVEEIERRLGADSEGFFDETVRNRERNGDRIEMGCLRFSQCRLTCGEGCARIWYSHSFDVTSHGIVIVLGDSPYREVFATDIPLSANVFYWTSTGNLDWGEHLFISRVLRGMAGRD